MHVGTNCSPLLTTLTGKSAPTIALSRLDQV